ncbi:MAG: BrnT family toxin [Verrucomicrobia bacterium]|nr:BrnT family toxin [Verrucomicrobiota bacterium]
MKDPRKFNPLEFTGFDWDSGNVTKNSKHGVEPEEAEEVFLNEPLLVSADVEHSAAEPRWHALGRAGQRWLAVVFTVRGKLIRVISARPMSRKEKAEYEKENLRS